MRGRDELIVENLGRAFFFSGMLTREAAGAFLTGFRNFQAAGPSGPGEAGPAAPPPFPGGFRWETRRRQQPAAER
jgi:hypothetical protein